MSEILAAPAPPAPFLGVRWRSVVGVWRRHVLALGRVWRVALTWFVIEPVFVLAAVALGVGRLVGDVDGHGPYATFVTPGIMVGTAMYHAIFEASWSVFERINQSVYDTVLTAPVTVTEIVLAELLFAVTRSLLSMVSVGIFAVGFGWLPIAAMPGMLAVGVGVGLVFGGIGLLFAALSPSIHVLSLVFTLIATPLFFFSGSFFPVSILPGWLQPVAWAAPLTPLVEIGRAFAESRIDAGDAVRVGYCLLLVAALIPAATRSMRRRLLK